MKDSSGESILVFGKMQKVLFMLCGGGWGISMGIQVSLGILLNEIYNEWGITYIEQSLIPICTMIGVFIGSYFWGILADKYGRAIAFNKVLLFIVLGIGIGVFSPNVWMLAGSYLITGFGIGGSFTVDGNVFLEYCPLEKQYLLTGISVLSAVGASIPAALALAFNSVSDFYRWRFIQGALGVIALLLSLPRFCIKETPTFLISDINPPSTPKDNLRERILSASPKHNAKEKSSKQQLLALTRKPVVKYTVLYIFIWFGTAFTFNGLANFLPVILTRSGFGQTNTDLYTMMLYQQLGNI
jgi:putative MFS transporter